MKKFIVLLTDFGNDFYVGQMKAVIKKINPLVEVIDLCNNIEPQNILQALVVISSSYKFFPANSIFVCVVDPGVGSKREIIIVKTKKYFFIAPDNGILTDIVKSLDTEVFKVIDNRYFLKPTSYTFHGRDIMAPLAAYISKGVKISKIAKKIDKKCLNLVEVPSPQEIKRNNKIILIGKYIFHDSFGNIVTNIKENLIDKSEISRYNLKIICSHRSWLTGLKYFYSEVKEGEILSYINSFGYVEVAVNKANAYNFFSKFDSIKNFSFELIKNL